MNLGKMNRATALKAIGATIPLPYFASIAGDKPAGNTKQNKRLVLSLIHI